MAGSLSERVSPWDYEDFMFMSNVKLHVAPDKGKCCWNILELQLLLTANDLDAGALCSGVEFYNPQRT